jgi:hypothetical protein
VREATASEPIPEVRDELEPSGAAADDDDAVQLLFGGVRVGTRVARG